MGWKKVFKKVGKVVALPVTLPAKGIRKGKEKVERYMIFSLIRHALSGVGLILVDRGLSNPDQINELVGAVLTVIGIIWSIYNGKKNKK